MNILVTGASTPLGVELVEQLLASPEVSYILAVGHGRRPQCFADFVRLRYHSVDLTRRRHAHDLLWGPAREHAIEVVVHMAQHRRASDHGRGVHAQNVAATRELLAACDGHPSIRRFVYRSFAEVYALDQPATNLLTEDAPLDHDPAASQWVRDRVEADLSVCAHRGEGFEITVLRCAEVFAAECGSQLWDYVQSRICLRPLGYDPMLNVLSVPDAASALVAAARSPHTGIFNIPGADTLPLSRAIANSMRTAIPVPGPLLAPLYGLRHLVTGLDFHYSLNAKRFRFGGIVDGSRARGCLGYEPRTRVAWPRPWWMSVLQRLAGSDREHAQTPRTTFVR